MKEKIIYLLIILFAMGCKKNPEGDKCEVSFEITETQTPNTASLATGVTTEIISYGVNGCYTFSHTEIKNNGGNSYEIRSKGTVLCDAKVCTQVLITARQSVHIKPSVPDVYILRFYNDLNLFKADTVKVN